MIFYEIIVFLYYYGFFFLIEKDILFLYVQMFDQFIVYGFFECIFGIVLCVIDCGVVFVEMFCVILLLIEIWVDLWILKNEGGV